MLVAVRWIKFEEDVEEGGERWSKPRVATLSLHSLFELRKGILTGTVLLDMTAVTICQMFGLYCSATLIVMTIAIATLYMLVNYVFVLRIKRL